MYLSQAQEITQVTFNEKFKLRSISTPYSLSRLTTSHFKVKPAECRDAQRNETVVWATFLLGLQSLLNTINTTERIRIFQLKLYAKLLFKLLCWVYHLYFIQLLIFCLIFEDYRSKSVTSSDSSLPRFYIFAWLIVRARNPNKIYHATYGNF